MYNLQHGCRDVNTSYLLFRVAPEEGTPTERTPRITFIFWCICLSLMALKIKGEADRWSAAVWACGEQVAYGAARVFFTKNNIGVALFPLTASKTFAGFNPPEFRNFPSCLRVCASKRRWNISLPLIRSRSNSAKIFIWKRMILK